MSVVRFVPTVLSGTWELQGVRCGTGSGRERGAWRCVFGVAASRGRVPRGPGDCKARVLGNEEAEVGVRERRGKSFCARVYAERAYSVRVCVTERAANEVCGKRGWERRQEERRMGGVR